MKEYVLHRFLQMIPTLVGVSIIVFCLFALLPGDYIDSNPRMTPERAYALKMMYGLDKPVIERYINWGKDIFTGNFGFSLKYQEPVTTLLNKFIWNSSMIAIISLFLTWSIALIAGTFSAQCPFQRFLSDS
jgi:peptide/nickel transport system permease protein